MKILFDVREIEKNKFSGIGRFVLSILKHKDYFNDFEFILVGNKKTDLENPILKNYKIFIINDSIPLISEQLLIYRLAKKLKVDLYLSPYYKYPVLLDIDVITSVFDLIYLLIYPYKNRIQNSFYIKNFIKYFTSKSKFIITSSFSSKKDIISFFNIDDDKIRVIYLPLDDSFKPQQDYKIKETLLKYGIKKDYILYVGSDIYHKNLNSLYNAYKLLPKDIKNRYELVFGGFIDKNNKYPLARVLGYVNDDDLKCLYSGANLFVFPSLYEGFGYPPLEAMACGAAVIASNTSSMPEVLGDGAIYFNPQDLNDIASKIEFLLNNTQLREQLRLKGLKRASFFSYDRFLYDMKLLFYEIFKR